MSGRPIKRTLRAADEISGRHRRPTLAGWDWIPTGFRTRFRRSHHVILSPLTGLSRHTRCAMTDYRGLAQRDRFAHQNDCLPNRKR